MEFDLNLKTSANFNAPYELFEFVKTAPEQMYIPNMSKLYVENYVEAVWLFASDDDKLIVGTRVKFLAGLMNASLDVEEMNIALSADEWNVQAMASEPNAKGTTIDSSSDVFEPGDLNGGTRRRRIVAIDLGATYDSRRGYLRYRLMMLDSLSVRIVISMPRC